MNKGKVVGFRVSENLHKSLLQLAEAEGSTISDVARNIITEHLRIDDVLHMLQEIGKTQTQGIAQLREELRSMIPDTASIKRGSGNNEDIVEIRRIVTLIARAMPAIAKYVQ
jgi:hypothetical protein